MKRKLQGDTAENQRPMRGHCRQLYANTIGQPRRKGQILRKVRLPRLSQEENLNRPTTSTEREPPITKRPTNRSSGSDGFTGEFYQTLREELTPVLLKLFQSIAEEGTLPSSFYEATIILVPKSDKDTTEKKNNYRLISLMTADGKILDKILVN